MVDAFYSVPRGGVEIGGILIGSAGEQGVRINGWRPIECRHASGPSFTLSQEDRDALASQLRGVVGETEDSGSKAVGWFHSHTRSGLFLSPEDLTLFDRFFPGERQVALLLRPKNQEPTAAAFFFRESNGTVRADSPHAEFVVAPRPRVRRSEPQPETVKLEPVPIPAAAPPVPEAPAKEVFHEAPRFTTAPARVTRWRPWMLILATLLAVVAGAAALLRPYLNYDSGEPLGLEAFDLDGQLLIKWNQMTQAVRQADTASLQIVDGVKKNSMELDRHMLRIGAVRYFRQNRRVELTLVVPRKNKTALEETMTFSAPLPDPPPPRENDPLLVRNRELEQEAAKLRQQVADWKRAWHKLADAKVGDGSPAPQSQR